METYSENIAKDLEKTLIEITKVDDFFTELYYCKKYMLMIEQLHGEYLTDCTEYSAVSFIYENLEHIRTIPELKLLVKRFNCHLKEHIPKHILVDWEVSDYEVYTDKYHHRKYWNEIDNGVLLDIIIERFIALYSNIGTIHTYDTYSTDKTIWNLRLYDFNDYNVYFESLEALEQFTNCFNPDTYTVYSREPEKNWWYEEYSV